MAEYTDSVPDYETRCMDELYAVREDDVSLWQWMAGPVDVEAVATAADAAVEVGNAVIETLRAMVHESQARMTDLAEETAMIRTQAYFQQSYQQARIDAADAELAAFLAHEFGVKVADWQAR